MTLTAGTISFVLTLMVFSYLLGDNLLYRITVSIFVGLSAAFMAIAVARSVILPLLDGTLGNSIVILIAGLLTILLMAKPLSTIKSLTNLALAFLIAVGAAVALVGGLTGTIIPLIGDTTNLPPVSDPLAFINGLIVLIGVVTSLLYFRYQAKRYPDGRIERSRLIGLATQVGQGFIVITLGAIYAGAILTSLTILSGQISILMNS